MYKRRIHIRKGSNTHIFDGVVFARTFLYSSITGVMNTTRKTAPIDYCEFVGYLFTDWFQCSERTVSQENSSLRWSRGRQSDRALKYEDIPFVFNPSAEDASELENDTKNFCKFAQKQSSLMFNAVHEALFNLNRKNRNIRSRKGSEVPFWKRCVNLVDAAAYFTKYLYGFDKDTTFFGMIAYHKASIVAFYSMSRALRRIIDHCHSDMMTEALESELEAAATENMNETSRGEDTECVAAAIESIQSILVPSTALQRRFVVWATFAVGEEYFKHQNVISDD